MTAGTRSKLSIVGSTLGVVLAGSAVFLWRKDRADMRGVLGELKSSAKP